VNVLIVDDQAPFRNAARMVVTVAPGFTVVGEAASGEEALDLAASLTPDLILMDINMPGIDGIETIRRLIAARPDTIAFLLSTYAVDDLPADARTCGARAYINKEDFSPAILRGLWDAGGDPDWQVA
jgi:two-component system, NarL family, invasion response regulator UvrY